MTKRRLGVGMRLAVVASLLWLIGGTLGFHMATMNQRNTFWGHLYSFCIEGYDKLQVQYPEVDYSKQRDGCSTTMVNGLNGEAPALQVLGASFLGSLAMLGIALLLGAIMYFTGRWILRGRQEPGGMR